MGICAYWLVWITRYVNNRQLLALILSAVVQAFSAQFVTCQEMASLLEQPKVLGGSAIVFGVDKIANTFTFTGKADVQTTLFNGMGLRFVNDLRSTVFRTTTLAVRHDQFSQLEIDVPITASISAIARQSWTLSQDSRSLGLASLERLNGGGGLRYRIDDKSVVEWIGGIEANTQIGRSAQGVVSALRAVVQGVDIDEWQLRGTAVFDLNRMDALRTNTDADVRTTIERLLDDGSELRLTAQWLSLRRQFFTQVGSLPDLSVETRAEQRLHLDASVQAPLSNTITVSAQGSLQSAGIDRQYGMAELEVPITAVNRRLSELVIDVSGEVRYEKGNVRLTAGAGLFRRDEQNGVQGQFALPDQELATIRAQENQRDNATVRTRMYGSGRVQLSENDTLRIEGASWLLRYDTPSALNFDDRDELTHVVTLQYGRAISSILSAGVVLSGQSVHLVFIRAQRSALNNVNRVLRLSPYVRIAGSVVSMQPQCEVLANFTVYDFEDNNSSVRSFSFRQVSLRDSIIVRFGGGISLESHVLLRYFERATLFWSRFAESPETANLERLTKMLIFSRPGTHVGVGVGVRLYGLEQRTLGGFPGPSTNRVFWAPEVSMRWQSPSGSEVSFGGWYEFQTIDGTQRRELPNLLLQARLTL